jgi:PAS domain S-box-containing protein
MTRASQVDPVHESAEADVSSQRPPISRGRVPVSSSCLMRYGVAVLATAATLLFRLALDAVLEDRVVFLPFTLALLVSAWYGGLGPGLLATGLGACVTVFVLLPPRWTPTVALLADGLSLVVFAIVGLGMSALVEQLHRARRRAEAEAAKRKAADEARRAHERFIQQMTDLSPVVLDVFDLVTGRHTYFSGRSVNLFGYTSEEMTQMHDQFAVLVYPDDMPRLAENLARLRRLADGEIHEFECRVRRRDGEWRWVAARSMVFARNEQGEVRQTVNATFDVTERKHAEEALRRARDALEQRVLERTQQLTAVNAELIKEIDERMQAEAELRHSEERFRLLVGSVRDYGIFALDPTGHVSSWNAGAEHIKRYRSEEIIGRHFSCFYPPEDLAIGKPEMELRVAAAEGRFEDEGWRIRKGGSRFWANVLITALHGAQGELVGFSKITRDLTERKQAEEKLGESERRFRLLAETISHHVWSCLPDGTVDYCNQRLLEYTGLTLQDMQHYGWTNSLHPDDVEPAAKAWRKAESQHQPYEVEVRLQRFDGHYRRFLSRAVPVYDERGQLMQWFGTYTDIERRKQAEEALGEAPAQLAHVTRMMTLGELTASIAHGVNQPLGAIVTNGQACLRLLARESPDLHTSREVVQRMISDGLRASDVITRIRALLKRHDAEKVLLNVNEIIQDVIALTNSELSRSEIHLRIALAADLPLVRGDRVQLQQVMLNLILNAKEAMSGGGGQPRALCITTLASTSGEAVVAVRDSGIGLDPRDGDRIFDAFVTTKAEGLGLGLSISRTIIEAHGGRLWATSNDGPGATVQFTLPIEH